MAHVDVEEMTGVRSSEESEEEFAVGAPRRVALAIVSALVAPSCVAFLVMGCTIAVALDKR